MLFERQKRVEKQCVYQIKNSVERSLRSVVGESVGGSRRSELLDRDEICKVELSVLTLREGRGLRLYLC